jgi:hypothetical protein
MKSEQSTFNARAPLDRRALEFLLGVQNRGISVPHAATAWQGGQRADRLCRQSGRNHANETRYDH